MNYKPSTVKDHEMSEIHKICVKAHEPIETSQAARALVSLNEKQVEQVQSLFKAAHSCVKQYKSFKDYVWLCDLIESTGSDIGHNYRTDKQAKLFVTYMAKNVRNQIAQKIIDASYFAITCDSATDFSSREQESIRIRLAYHGAVFDHLVGFEAPGTNVNAEGILEAILKGVSKVGITADTIKSKMSSIALDGASVNIGKHRSVVKLCQNLNPAILPVHCFSHRLELAFWDTAKSVVTFKKVYTLLQGLYTFYHYSAKQEQLLIDTACKQKTECLIPTHASGTRWIAHWVTALQNMQRGYKTLVAQLSEVPKQKGVRVETSGKAKGLRKLLLNKDVISFSMHMIDVLLPLKRLSLFLQQECSLAAEVHAVLQDTLTALREYQDSNYKGIYSEKVYSNYFEGAAFIPSRTGPNLECEVEKFVTGLICNLQKRLTPGTDIVLQAANVANLIAWPENDSGNSCNKKLWK